MRHLRLLAVSLLAAAAFAAEPVAGAPPSAALIARCEACHGDKAGSRPDAARLNGLSRDYLFARLNAFSAPIDQSPHAIDNMWSSVINMDNNDKIALADHFASQPAPATKLGGPAEGKEIYEKGLPAQGIAACQSCHGPHGEGQGTAPRLAGQKQAYLTMQLWAFTFVARVHGAMNARATKFSAEQIDSLAAYLAGR